MAIRVCLIFLAIVLAVLAYLAPTLLCSLLWAGSHASSSIQEKWNPSGGYGDFNKVRGKCASPFITSKRIDELDNGTFLAQEGDIWVTTYPKSGTTWTQTIVNLVNGYPPSGDVFLNCPWPEVELGPMYLSLEDLNNLPKSIHGTRCLKSHWTNEDHMAHDDRKVIYVMRNVMDVAVSFYHHFLLMPCTYDFHGTWDEFFKIFIAGDVDNGNWFDHVATWWPHRNNSRVLFLRYEEMKKDTPKAIREIARFHNASLSETQVSDILEKSSFKYMRSKNFQDPMFKFLKFMGLWRGSFIRKGIVGDSKNYFTQEQINVVLNQYNQKLKPLGVPIEWCLLSSSG